MTYYKLFAVFGLLLTFILGIAAYMDNNREWKKYQNDFFQLELKRLQHPKRRRQ